MACSSGWIYSWSKQTKEHQQFPVPWALPFGYSTEQGTQGMEYSRPDNIPSYPTLALVTADGPAMACITGWVGHHGHCHCHYHCPLIGRHKPGGSHYYPACLKPGNYDLDRCNHEDVNINDILSLFDSQGATDTYFATSRRYYL